MRRRKVRELALQVLFQVDLVSADPEKALQGSREIFGIKEEALTFPREIIFGVFTNIAFLDKIIKEVALEWQLYRMAYVDRNIMRIALYEMFFCDKIPPGVSINEAVELAKTFGGEDSWRFVNGILGKIVKNMEDYKPVRI